MKYLVIVFFICSTIDLYSQTYSKLLELQDLTENILMDMEVHDNHIYLATRHQCDPDTSDNSKIACTALSKLSISAEVLDSRLFDTLSPEGFNRLLVKDNNVYLSGHHHVPFSGRSIIVSRLNTELIPDSLFYITNDQNHISNNEGLIERDDKFFLYGNIKVDSTFKSHIIYMDSAFNVKNTARFSRVTGENHCHDLQFTSDGNLIYANRFSSGFGASSVSGQQIMVIDTAFNKVDSLEFDGFIKDRSGTLRLLASSTGHVYCMTNRHPHGSILPSHGHINKYSSDLDSLIWSLKLPFNNFINGRRYTIKAFYEASNGDILACGRTYDSSPNALQDQINNGFHGYLVRVSPTGEIKYLRVYKVPHFNDIISSPDFSIFHTTSLWNIHELEDGRLLLGGTAGYNSRQLSVIFPAGDPLYYTWLLTVDENGCLEGEECQEVIILDGEVKNSPPIFPVGTKWTYEYFPDPIDPSKKVYSYITYEVTDTVMQNDTVVYIIENNRRLPEERMIQGDNEVWFWDKQGKFWQKTYDFDAMTSYETKFGGGAFTTYTEVKIDTTEYFTFGDRGIVDLDKVTIEDNGTLEEPLHLSILDRCGNVTGGHGLRLGLGLNLWDPVPFYAIGNLRCFEQDTFFYNFNGLKTPVIPCDSTWSEIIDNVDAFERSDISIFPNPTYGSVSFKGLKLPTQYELYGLDGKLFKSGILEQDYLTIEREGFFIIKLLHEGRWISEKIVRY
jgi:hypothetical protein